MDRYLYLRRPLGEDLGNTTLDNIPVALSQWYCAAVLSPNEVQRKTAFERAAGDRHSSGGPRFWVGGEAAA